MSTNDAGTVLILHVPVAETRGGAEILIDGLKSELERRGFAVGLAGIPFTAIPKRALVEQIARWRCLPVDELNGRKVDIVIPTKFPSYLVCHPNKRPWLIHQHRQVYELYGSRFGDFAADPEDENLRRMVQQADAVGLAECQKIFTISPNVSARLERYLGIPSQVLAPPLPLGERYFHSQAKPYILSVGRLCSIKRVDLLLRSLPHIPEELKLKVVGLPDEPAIEEYLRSEIAKHNLAPRVEFLGRVTEDQLLDLFAECFAVYYAPYDEDYGFVTLEALASGKPVVTAVDSGGVLEYIQHEQNGLVVEPNETAIAQGFSQLWNDKQLYDVLLANTTASSLTQSWDEIVNSLTQP